MSGAEGIASQLASAGLVPGTLVGQEAVSKTYVDGQVSTLSGQIADQATETDEAIAAQQQYINGQLADRDADLTDRLAVMQTDIDSKTLVPGMVTTAIIAAEAVTLTRLAPDSIDRTKIRDGEVTGDHLESYSVGRPHIRNGNVNLIKLASDAIDSANHRYYGNVTGQNTTKGAIDYLQQRITNIVSYSGSSNQEIVDSHLAADGTLYDSLGNRLDDMEARLLGDIDAGMFGEVLDQSAIDGGGF